METFEWPALYNFPPFFTIQVNDETKNIQLEVWAQLVLDYCKAHKMFILDRNDTSLSLFNNHKISRQLTIEGVTVVLNYMKSKEMIHWIDSANNRCYVFWYTPAQWGSMIHKYADENGLANSVATFNELIEADQEFQGMSKHMMIFCLRTLGDRVEIMGEDGVKFFH